MNKIKLLIVDDCEMNRYLLGALCNSLEEFETYEAVDGQDAVDQCETIRPSIILMDMMMPRLDGFQASKQIKVRYPNTIIIAVTTMAELDIVDKITAAGMVSYIRKPIDKNQLYRELKSYSNLLEISSDGR